MAFKYCRFKIRRAASPLPFQPRSSKKTAPDDTAAMQPNCFKQNNSNSDNGQSVKTDNGQSVKIDNLELCISSYTESSQFDVSVYQDCNE